MKKLLILLAVSCLGVINAFSQTYTVTSLVGNGNTWEATCNGPTPTFTNGSFLEGIRRANLPVGNASRVTVINFSVSGTIDMGGRTSDVELCGSGVTINGNGINILFGQDYTAFRISGNNNNVNGISTNRLIHVTGNNNTLDNITSTVTGAYVSINISGGANGTIVSNCTISGVTTAAKILIAESRLTGRSTASNTTITKCNISQGWNAIQVGALALENNFGNTLGDATNVTISDCDLHNNDNSGIFFLKATNSNVTNNKIYNNRGNGINILGSSGINIGSSTQGNFIYSNGNATRTMTEGERRGHGICLYGSGESPQIGSINCKIIGNYIGISSATSTVDEGNHINGVYVERTSGLSSTVDNNLIEGNVIAFNGYKHQVYGGPTRAQIQLWDVNSNQILGNYIGTNKTGEVLAIPSQYEVFGISINGGSRNKIGGTLASERNYIGNCDLGIAISGTETGADLTPQNNEIIGNSIGVFNAKLIPNSGNGINVNSGSGHIIGGSTAAHGNTIKNNLGTGVQLSSITSSILRNDISSNGAFGVSILSSGGNNTGANNTINNNTITNNGSAGVSISGATAIRNGVRFNSISCNNGKGIQLVSNGNSNFGFSGTTKTVTVNPSETRANFVSGRTPDGADEVDIYIADGCTANCSDPKFQGATFVTTVTVQNSNIVSSGITYDSWELNITSHPSITDKSKIVVVAKRTPSVGLVETSEFSECRTFCQKPTKPSFNSGLATLSYCTGTSAVINIDNSTLTANTTYELMTGTTLVDTKVYTGSNAPIQFIISNPGTYFVKAYTTGDPNCFENSNNLVVTELPLPNPVTIVGNIKPCKGSQETYTVTPTQTGLTYTWTLSNTNATKSDNGSSTSLTMNTVGPVIIGLTVLTASSPICSRNTQLEINIQDVPKPTITGPASACEASSGTYNVVNPLGTSTFAWTGGGNATITPPATGTSATATFGAAGQGTVSVTETDLNGCKGTSPNTIVTINPRPVTPTITGVPNDICAGTTDTLIVVSGAANATFAWTVTGATIVSGQGTDKLVVLFDAVGSVTASVTMTNETSGCSDLTPETKTITVRDYAKDIVINIIGKDSACVGENLNLSVSPITASSTYTWSVPTGGTIVSGQSTSSLSVNFAATAIGSQQITVSETTQFGCKAKNAAAPATVRINPLPTPKTITGNDKPQCNSTGNVYTITGADASSTYAWTVPTGATFTGSPTSTITVDFADNSGNIGVTETNKFGCKATYPNFPITLIGCALNANFTVADSTCTNSAVTFTDISTPQDGSIVKYTWSFGADATPATADTKGPHSVVYSTSGVKSIRLIIEDKDGAKDTTDKTITVNARPVISAITGKTPVCAKTLGEIYSVVEEANHTYAWSVLSGDGVISSGSGNASVSVNFGSAATTLKVISTNVKGCTDSTTKTVAINPLPDPSQISGTQNVCQGDTVSYVVSGGANSTFSWTTSPNTVVLSGSTNDTIRVVFGKDASGTFSVSEITAEGCADATATRTFTVSSTNLPNKPVFDNTADDACINDQKVARVVSIPDATYDWTAINAVLNGATNQSSVNVTYNVATVAILNVKVSVNGCTSDTAQATLDVEVLDKLASPILSKFKDGKCETDTVEVRVLNPDVKQKLTWSLTPSDANYISQNDSIINLELVHRALVGDRTRDEVTVTARFTNDAGCASEPSSVKFSITPPTISDGITGSDSACSINTGRNYTFNADYNFGDVFVWSITPQDNNDIIITNQNSINVTFGENPIRRDLTVKIYNSECPFDTITRFFSTRVLKTDTIVTKIIPDTVCNGVSNTYFTKPLICSSCPTGFIGYYTWIGNNGKDTIRMTQINSFLEKEVFTGDSIKVSFAPYEFFCFNPLKSNFKDSLRLFSVEKPKVSLVATETKWGFDKTDGKTYYLSDLGDTKLVGTSENQLISTLQTTYSYTYGFYWLDRKDTMINGKDTTIFFGNNKWLTNNTFFTPQNLLPKLELNSTMLEALTTREKTTLYFEVAHNYCSNVDSIVVINNFGIFIPKVFSPNNDGTFDLWKIKNVDRYPKTTIRIFNRWGNEVYSAENGYNNDWDGTQNGKPLPMGTYFYTVDLGTGAEPLAGPVTIVR